MAGRSKTTPSIAAALVAKCPRGTNSDAYVALLTNVSGSLLQSWRGPASYAELARELRQEVNTAIERLLAR